MTIAVNTCFILHDPKGYGNFIREIFEVLVKDHPEDEFYFLHDRPVEEQPFSSANAHSIVFSPPVRQPVLFRYWLDAKLPFVLKKIRADVLVSADGYGSFTTKVPQCLVVHDLGFLHHPGAYKRSHQKFLKRNTARSLNKAGSIVTVSRFSKDDISKYYKTEPSKIDVVHYGVKEKFRPLSFDEREAVKEKYTEGIEYFLYPGKVQRGKNLVTLLKAFSIFKKRLQSSMKLVLAGELSDKKEELLQLIDTYKYRSDVVLTGHLPKEERPFLMGAAYALLYPSFSVEFALPVSEAMKCEVPVLTSSKTSIREVAGEAGLYFDPEDHADIADKMMLIYKDENLRNVLIEKGKSAAGRFNWKVSAGLFWQSILKAAEK